MPLHVALNATPLLSPLTGIGNYILHLGQALAAAGEVQLSSFCGYRWQQGAPIERPEGGRGMTRPKLRHLVKPFVPWKRELRQTAQRFAFGKGVRRYGIDLYHEPNYVPISTDIPFVTTIHDLSWLRYPETHPIDRIRWLEKGLPRAIERAQAILVDSECVRDEVLSTFAIAPTRVYAVHLGASDAFRPRTFAETGNVLRPLGLTHGAYLLAVGTVEPRKNLAHILESYALLPAGLRQRFPLVIAGAKGWRSSEILSRLRCQNDPQVRFLGRVEALELAHLYAGAALFAFPSFYEGFGLPPLEAMASGAPVIVSNRASLPEIVGTAGQMMNPDDPGETALQLQALLEDPVRRVEMSRLGVERASQFTWALCAEATCAVYRAALDTSVLVPAATAGPERSSKNTAQDAVK